MNTQDFLHEFDETFAGKHCQQIDLAVDEERYQGVGEMVTQDISSNFKSQQKTRTEARAKVRKRQRKSSS